MQVIVTKAQLETARACPDYLKSPEWNGEALVYTDWAASVVRLLSTPAGRAQLSWLVTHKLVPMTLTEYIIARKSVRAEIQK